MKLKCIIVLSVISLYAFAENNEVIKWTESYNKYLLKYVHAGERSGIKTNYVDYDGLRKTQFKSLKSDLENINDFKFSSKNEKLAFWINVYNYLTVYKIIENPKIKKITDLNEKIYNVWKQKAGFVLGKERTLDEIEHQILRKMEEPRIHFAIVCASISCPDLRPEAFTSEKLESQLSDQLVKFAKNAKKGLKIDHKNNFIYLSKIFSWFEGDFKPSVSKWLLERNLIGGKSFKKYRVKYFDYNWYLNE